MRNNNFKLLSPKELKAIKDKARADAIDTFANDCLCWLADNNAGLSKDDILSIAEKAKEQYGKKS